MLVMRSRAILLIPLADMIFCRRLHWLGHNARMSNGCLSKWLLLGLL